MHSRLAAATLVLGLSTSAFAAPPDMSLAQYMARKKQIAADYSAERSACGARAPSANARQVCLADAMGKDHVAKADLEVDYRSTPRTLLEATEARLAAAYWLARERCGEIDYKLEARCVQDAKAAEMAAKADARERSRAVQAKLSADEDRAAARARGNHAATQARARAAAGTRDAPDTISN